MLESAARESSPAGGAPLRSSFSDAAKLSLLLGAPVAMFAAFTPFTIPGDEWVELLDDGEPACKRLEIHNDGDDAIEVEITWGDDDRSKKTFPVGPKNSILFECRVARIRVRRKGGIGWWTLHAAPTFIVMHGPGHAYYREPGTDTIMTCKTFSIRNSGKKAIKVRFTRDSPGQAPDEKKDVDVAPGNTVTIRCRIRSVDIEGDRDSEAWVEELDDLV